MSGTVAGGLGIGVAVLAGYGVTGAMAASGVANAPALVVPWAALGGCLLVAVLATVLAALAPALAAARIPPIAALGSAGAGESGAPRPGRRLLLTGGLVVVAVGSAATVLGREASNPLLPLVVLAGSGLAAFAALVAVGPVLVRGLAATIGRGIAAVGRAPGRLAAANAMQVPRRTAATISVLALGVGLTSALLVALASAEVRSERSVAELFPAAIAVSTADPAAMAARLAAAPQLRVAQRDDRSVYVDPAAGVDAATARQAVDRAVVGQPGVSIQYASDVRAEVQSTISLMRLIGLALVGMTMLVAVVGVMVTLMLSVTERTRETGLLRAVGLSRGGVRAMVAWEAALSGIAAAVLGAVIGSLYGVLSSLAIGIGVGFVASSLGPLVALVLGVVALAVAAAIVPAARAGRVPPIRALHEAL